MKFGIHLGHMGGPLDEMRKLWKFADAKGFDWFSVSDHFQESPPRGGDMDCYEAIPQLRASRSGIRNAVRAPPRGRATMSSRRRREISALAPAMPGSPWKTSLFTPLTMRTVARKSGR